MDWKPIETAPRNGRYILAYKAGWIEPHAVAWSDALTGEIDDELDEPQLGWIAHPAHGLSAVDDPDIWAELPPQWHDEFVTYLQENEIETPEGDPIKEAG